MIKQNLIIIIVRKQKYLFLNIDSGFDGVYQIYDLNGRSVGKGKILMGENEVDTSLLQS